MELNYSLSRPDLYDGSLSKSDEDAGYDLRTTADTTVPPHGRALVSTGVFLCLPVGVAGLVTPRSGLAISRGLTVLNSPGLVDPGYRGEVGVVLHNTDPWTHLHFDAGDRIAQLVLVRYELLAANPVEIDAFDGTARGAQGFGSTGGT